MGCFTVVINLQALFLKAALVAGVVFGALWVARPYVKAVPGKPGAALCALRELLAYLCAQIILNLMFLLSYVFYTKNEKVPDLSDLSVGFIFISVVFFFIIWRYGALSAHPASLVPPALYSGFLLYRFFASGGGVGFFGYFVFNPMFGLIGSGLVGGIGAVSALLPLAAAGLGRGLAVKRIDKKGGM